MKEVTIDNVKLRVYCEGEGFPLLFLHGFGGRIESFMPVISHYQATRRIISLDLAGFGNSDEPPIAWKVDDYVRLVRQVLSFFHVTQTDIIAHSFGGRIALKLAVSCPALVRKMTLVDAAGVKPRRGMRYWAKVLSYKFARKLWRHGLYAGFTKKSHGSSDYAELSEVMKATFIGVVNEDLTKISAGITCPVLLIYGKEDRDTPVYMGRTLNRKIKNSRLEIWSDCGHFSYLDKLFVFLQETEKFWRE